MKSEVIREVSELKIFDEKIIGYTGVKFSMQYWQKCKVVAFYNQQREMIGGYALALEPPFRSLFTLAKSTEDYMKFVEEVAPEQMIEASALWLDTGARSLRNKVTLFQAMLNDICEHDKPYLLYVYNLNKLYLQTFYGKLRPRVIFRGMLPGAMPNSHPVGIECALTAEIKQEMKSARYRFLSC